MIGKYCDAIKKKIPKGREEGEGEGRGGRKKEGRQRLDNMILQRLAFGFSGESVVAAANERS